jgi:hypothetical protein
MDAGMMLWVRKKAVEPLTDTIVTGQKGTAEIVNGAIVIVVKIISVAPAVLESRSAVTGGHDTTTG